MRIKNAVFVKSAAGPEHYPSESRAEIAFIGRSNVGKSSLINSLLGRKGLARTSSTPGRTQLINFFLINDAFYFVDLPGYGWARAPQHVRQAWGPMVEGYLAGRSNLVLSILITDSRQGPTNLDLRMKEWLTRTGKPFFAVATKADKLSANKLNAGLTRAAEVLQAKIIPYSSVTGQNRDAVLKQISNALKA